MKHYMLIATTLLIPVMVAIGCASIPKPPRGAQSVERNLVVTGYCPCRDCCNWHRNWYGKTVVKSGPAKGQKKKVGQTASGGKAKVGTIAADTSKYPFGTIMHIPGYGYGRVEDRGSAIKGDHIDLYFKSHQEALKWGRVNKTVKVWMR